MRDGESIELPDYPMELLNGEMMMSLSGYDLPGWEVPVSKRWLPVFDGE
jgi:hypothetical protein